MSALFQRGQGVFSEDFTIDRGLELRRIPLLFEVEDRPTAVSSEASKGDVLGNLFTGLSTNWMYGAIIELVLNGSHPSWSQDGWNFVPLDVSSLSGKSLSQSLGNGSDSADFVPETLCSVSTPALRARVECSPYEEISEPMDWLEVIDLTDSDLWNTSVNPKDITTAYRFSMPFYNTTLLADNYDADCCTNATSDDKGEAAFGYWSHIDNSPSDTRMYANVWPESFATKWVHGNMSRFRYGEINDELIFTSIPDIQALRCVPTIETAEANVTVDIATGRVNSYKILGSPTAVDDAWTNGFVLHEAKFNESIMDAPAMVQEAMRLPRNSTTR